MKIELESKFEIGDKVKFYAHDHYTIKGEITDVYYCNSVSYIGFIYDIKTSNGYLGKIFEKDLEGDN